MVLAGPCTRDTPCSGRERGATGAFGRGVAATPLLHTQNCRMSRDRGIATPWSATEGGCSVYPTKGAASENCSVVGVIFNIISAKTKRGRREGDGKTKKKRHDNLRQTSRQFTTFYGNLRHYMTISVSLFH